MRTYNRVYSDDRYSKLHTSHLVSQYSISVHTKNPREVNKLEQEKHEKYKKILKLISNGNLIDVVQEDCCKIILKDAYITEDVIQSTIEYYRILRWLYILKKDSEESDP